MKIETIEKILNFLEEKEGHEIPEDWSFAKEKLKLIEELENHPDGVQYKYGADLDLSGSSIKKLPNKLYVIGDLNLFSSNITKLPNDLYVDGSLYLIETGITELPDNLYVGDRLILRGCTQLSKLPDNLYVGGDLHVYGTPLANKYSNDEIRDMIISTGGEIKGEIYR